MTTSGGSVVVNVTPNSYALQAALAADFPAGSYTLNTVSTSLLTLESDTLTMSQGGSAISPYLSLSSSPFVIVSLAPVANDTVQVIVIGDTAVAQSTLTNLFPGFPLSVVADPGFTLPVRTANKGADTINNWSDGDNLNNIGAYGCTDDFAFRGNSSGNLYQYTAAHCVSVAGEAVKNNNNTIGTIASIYGENPYGFSYDFASFGCNACSNDNVWYNNSGNGYTLTADCGSSCYSGQVTMDPGIAGGNPGVQQPNYNVQWSGPGGVNYGGGYVVSGAEYATTDGTYPNGCPSGASGSPVYQRHSGNTVWAAGLLIANTGNVGQCYYEVTGTIESAANASLWL